MMRLNNMMMCFFIAAWLVFACANGWGGTPAPVVNPDMIEHVRERKTIRAILAQNQSLIHCPLLTRGPKVDGIMEPGEWSGTCKISGFINAEGDEMAPVQTTVWLGYDNDSLYLAVSCPDNKIVAEIAPSDKKAAKVWQDDLVDIALMPDDSSDTICHFMFNPRGARYDYRWERLLDWVERKTYEWDVAARQDEGVWLAEVRIPFSSLGMVPHEGDSWKIGICRVDKTDTSSLSFASEHIKGVSSWPTISICRWWDVKWPEDYGTMKFGGQALALGEISLGDTDESQTARFKVKNTGSQAVSFTPGLELLSAFGKRNFGYKIVSLKPGEERECRLKYEIDRGGRQILVLNLVSPGKELLYCGVYPLDISFLFPRILLFSEQLSDFSSVLSNPALKGARELPELKKEIPELRARVDSLSKQVKESIDTGTKDTLLRELCALEESVQQTRNRMFILQAVLRHPDLAGKEYLVGIDNSLDKIFKEPWKFSGGFDDTVSLAAAGNESESFQIAVIPRDKELKGVKLVMSSLINGKTNTRIDAKNVAYYPVEYVRTMDVDRYRSDYVGLWPDPLMERDVFTVSPGTLQPVWITVYVPPGTAAGLYEGVLKIMPANSNPAEVKVRLNVWDFTLPGNNHLEVIAPFTTWLPGYYGLSGVNPLSAESGDLVLKFSNFLLDRYRVAPWGAGGMFYGAPQYYFNWKDPAEWKFSLIDERMKAFFNKGVESLCVFDLAFCTDKTKPDFPGQFEKFMGDYYNHLQEEGLLEKSWIYIADEVPADMYGRITPNLDILKRVAPKLRRGAACYHPLEERKQDLDIWITTITSYLLCPDKWEEMRRAGKELWWVTNCASVHPYPNFIVDYPSLDTRIIPWMCWKGSFTGLVDWQADFWSGNRIRKGEKRWPEREWVATIHGDGYLAYPGPDGNPLGSIRLEVLRDGIEDYEYLWMLDSLAKEKERYLDKSLRGEIQDCLSVSRAVIRDYANFVSEPQVLFKERERIAGLIEKLQSVATGGNK